MPSRAMQDAIDAEWDRRHATAGHVAPSLDEQRAAFAPADRLYPIPDDVVVTDVVARSVPAHWLDAPET